MQEYSDTSYQAYPLSFDSAIPNPSVIPPAPDELVAHIRKYHRGLSRCVVKVWHGRKRYSNINSVVVGAERGETPSASVDQIVRAVMSIGQDHYEGIDQACKFMVQSYVWPKETGDPIRKAVHFEIGDAGYGGDPYSEQINAPEALDDILLSHIRDCHKEVLDQSRIIQEIGKEAIQNAGAVFRARQEALDAQAEANSVVLSTRADENIERSRQKKWDRMFGMMEKMMNTGVAQAIASGAGAGIQQALMPGQQPVAGSVVQQAVPETPRPAWASAAMGKPAIAPPQNLEDETDHTKDDEDDVPDDLDYKAQGKELYASITAEQWPDLFDLLTKAQTKALRSLKDPESNEAVLVDVAKFREGLKESSFKALARILTVPQIATVLQLAGAAEAEADDDDPDSDENE